MTDRADDVPPADDELWALVDAAAAGTASPPDRDRLEDRLRADRSARRFYVNYLDLHANLQWRTRGQTGPRPAEPRLSRLAKRRVSPAWLVAVVAVAAAVVVAVYLPRQTVADDAASPELASLPEGAVAVLIDAGRSVWERGTDAPTRTGSALNPGATLKLRSGVAEVAFRAGGAMLIEGPADFDVTSEAGAFVRRGKLTAKAPAGAAIRVAMPGLVVTDAGECGVLRDEAGRAEVHAFTGRVGADPTGAPTRWIEKAATRIDPAGPTFTTVPLNATAFARLRPDVRIADASVRGGRFADENFGTAPLLMVKNSIPDYSWESYLRFDLSGVPGRVTGAVVRLVPVRVGMAVTNAAAVAEDEAWAEAGIVWATAPGSGPRVAQWVAEEGKPVTFDVTPFVQDAVAADRPLTLRIFAPKYKRGGSHVQYGSREGPPDARPQLLITTARDAEARILWRPWFLFRRDA